MGKLSNGEDNVTINEVTVSHRATKNSPHDACTWDPHGIRGVSMDGIQVFTNEMQVIRSVNVSIGGVSFECDAAMLDVLADKEARDSLVTRSQEAQAEKERIANTPHDWVEDEGKRTADGAAWQCSKCKGWVVGPKQLERPVGGCLGRAPNEQEKRQADAQAAIQDVGRRLQLVHETAREALQNGALAINVMGAVELDPVFRALAAINVMGAVELDPVFRALAALNIAAADADLDQTETPAE